MDRTRTCPLPDHSHCIAQMRIQIASAVKCMAYPSAILYPAILYQRLFYHSKTKSQTRLVHFGTTEKVVVLKTHPKRLPKASTPRSLVESFTLWNF